MIKKIIEVATIELLSACSNIAEASLLEHPLACSGWQNTEREIEAWHKVIMPILCNEYVYKDIYYLEPNYFNAFGPTDAFWENVRGSTLIKRELEKIEMVKEMLNTHTIKDVKNALPLIGRQYSSYQTHEAELGKVLSDAGKIISLLQRAEKVPTALSAYRFHAESLIVLFNKELIVRHSTHHIAVTAKFWQTFERKQ